MRRHVPLLSVPVIATFVALAALVALAACQTESEGYPCSTLNGNNDCTSPLVCVTPPNPNATNAPQVCCPPAGQAPTTPECTLNGQVDAGNPAPPDGSTFPESGTDGPKPEAASTQDSSSPADTGTSSSDAGPG
jgi:hypothetical protein